MKTLTKTLALVVLAGATGILFTGCASGGHSHQYTCPMKEHSDVLSDQPGKCSKCGMKLVEKN